MRKRNLLLIFIIGIVCTFVLGTTKCSAQENIEVGDFTYKIINEQEKTVEIVKYVKYYDYTEVNIPNKVEINGTIYNVTQIGQCAFLECEKIEKIVIPNSVIYRKYGVL